MVLGLLPLRLGVVEKPGPAWSNPHSSIGFDLIHQSGSTFLIGEAAPAPPGEKSKWIPAQGRNDGGFPASKDFYNTPAPVGFQSAFARICRWRSCGRMGQDRAREPGGIRMHADRENQTDAATRVPPAMEAALSAGSEFPKNSINIDKFTRFFDKFPKSDSLATYCNTRISGRYMSAGDSSMTEKSFKPPHLPAFAMI